MQIGKAIVEASISAIIIRADGTREELGTVAYWHANPLRRLLFALKQLVKKQGG